jgi:hypothetical protein
LCHFAALLAACRYARIAVNLALLYGFYVTFSRDGPESIARGFPILGAAAGAHGVIGVLAMRTKTETRRGVARNACRNPTAPLAFRTGPGTTFATDPEPKHGLRRRPR